MLWRFADLQGVPIGLPARDPHVESDRLLRSYVEGRLVRLERAIADLDSWATRPEDIETLEQLERVRDDLRGALVG
jgi:hypothetical protein